MKKKNLTVLEAFVLKMEYLETLWFFQIVQKQVNNMWYRHAIDTHNAPDSLP